MNQMIPLVFPVIPVTYILMHCYGLERAVEGVW